MVELGHKKAGLEKTKPAFYLSRGDKIRTCDLCVPNAALYQPEPRLEKEYFN